MIISEPSLDCKSIFQIFPKVFLKPEQTRLDKSRREDIEVTLAGGVERPCPLPCACTQAFEAAPLVSEPVREQARS
jgi:hypothetical protein